VAGYFFDTSAIVKRYVSELGSGWVNALTTPTARNRVYLVRITAVEVASAITRWVHGGSLPPADGILFLTWFRHDYANQYRLIGVTPGLIEEAMILAERPGLRGYDAVQLSAAFRVTARRKARGTSGSTFVSADTSLLAAATAEGLAVEDPNNHP
jgi:uncharacterized protein